MLDLVRLAYPHFKNFLQLALNLYGVVFEAYESVPTSEISGDLASPEALYGDFDYKSAPYTQGKVLVGKSGFMGMESENFITLADKIEEDVMLYTTSVLHIDDKIKLIFPDNKSLSLRIVSPDTQHMLSTLPGIYIGRVV